MHDCVALGLSGARMMIIFDQNRMHASVMIRSCYFRRSHNGQITVKGWFGKFDVEGIGMQHELLWLVERL
jgi:hypothetical protein